MTIIRKRFFAPTTPSEWDPYDLVLNTSTGQEISNEMRDELAALYSMRHHFSDRRPMEEWLGVSERRVNSLRNARQDKRRRNLKIEREIASAKAEVAGRKVWQG